MMYFAYAYLAFTILLAIYTMTPGVK